MKQVESQKVLFRCNSRLRYQKTTLKSTCFGLEKGLAAFLHNVHMDLLFLPSVLYQVSKFLSSFLFKVLSRYDIKLWLLNSESDTDFIPSVSNIPPTPTGPKKNRTGLIAGIVVGIGLLSLLSIIAILWIVRRRNRLRMMMKVKQAILLYMYDSSPISKLGTHFLDINMLLFACMIF